MDFHTMVSWEAQINSRFKLYCKNHEQSSKLNRWMLFPSVYYYFILLVTFGAVSSLSAEFSTIEIGKIRLSVYESDWQFGMEAAQMAGSSKKKLSHAFRLPDSIHVHLIVAPTELIFHRLTGGQIPDWGIAAANGKERRIFLKSPKIQAAGDNLNKIIDHEMSHVFMALNTNTVPRWFDEGVALYFSGELGWNSNILLARSLLMNQIVPLDDIDHVFEFQRDKAALVYRESLSVIEFLVAEYGVEGLSRILMTLSEGGSVENAFLKITGISFKLFEQKWEDYLKQTYIWYAVFDTRFILSFSFVLLFILAWIRKTHDAKTQNKNWEQEELEQVKDKAIQEETIGPN